MHLRDFIPDARTTKKVVRKRKQMSKQDFNLFEDMSPQNLPERRRVPTKPSRAETKCLETIQIFLKRGGEQWAKPV